MYGKEETELLALVDEFGLTEEQRDKLILFMEKCIESAYDEGQRSVCSDYEGDIR